jgi:hypothetical protein|nr:MAG TPA: hypothetical protein [Caudoviricetes sp.]
MLDFGKLQADAVKNIYKSKITGKAADYRIYSAVTIDGNNYIPLMYKGISIYLIPENYSLLNPAFAEVNNSAAEKIFKSAEDAYQLTDTKMIKLLSNGKRLKKFKTPMSTLIFVDEKLIKPFGQGIKYYAVGNGEVVYIKEAEEFLGLALATRKKVGAESRPEAN